jgi:ribosomal protein S18 acetylase RimI-like enzyme
MEQTEKTSGVKVRAAKPSEHSAVDELAVEAWEVLKPGYDPSSWEGLVHSLGKTSRLAESGTLLVAVAGELVCGAVVYMPPGRSNPKIFPPSWPSIRMLVVAPSHRGHGIGRQLTEACIEQARQDEARCIGLHTSPIMSVALPMYLRMGFVRDADLPPIAGAPYARYVLEL